MRLIDKQMKYKTRHFVRQYLPSAVVEHKLFFLFFLTDLLFLIFRISYQTLVTSTHNSHSKIDIECMCSVRRMLVSVSFPSVHLVHQTCSPAFYSFWPHAFRSDDWLQMLLGQYVFPSHYANCVIRFGWPQTIGFLLVSKY